MCGWIVVVGRGQDEIEAIVQVFAGAIAHVQGWAAEHAPVGWAPGVRLIDQLPVDTEKRVRLLGAHSLHLLKTGVPVQAQLGLVLGSWKRLRIGRGRSSTREVVWLQPTGGETGWSVA